MDTRAQKKWLLMGMAMVLIVIALGEWLNPGQARPDGRWSFMYAWTWDLWGSNGVAGFFLVEAAIFLGLSCLFRRK